ncbi:hypothetical protein GCM10027299_54100 [Larkinella ripae]
MNVTKDISRLMGSSFSGAKSPSFSFTSLPQAISCANKFFMEGFNAQIIARDKNSFLVVSPDIARQLAPKGFRPLYGN